MSEANLQQRLVRHLSLFSGCGGELLASTHLLNWRTIGYVEWVDYRQRVIAERISEGLLHEAPIFGNIDTFIGEGFAESYSGMVDVITAGFPCQGWSSIGKQAGEKDDRNKWPETRDAIRIIRPRYVQLENSPNIISKGFIGRIIKDLAALGYVGRYTRLSGLHAGAHSQRERFWLKAELPDPISGRLERRHDFIKEWETKNRSIPPLGKNIVRLDLPDPRAFRADNGNPRRVDRTSAVGDMQIPAVAATAWQIL